MKARTDKRTQARRGRPRKPLRSPEFSVPFCSNPNCPYFYHPPEGPVRWCVHHGSYQTKAHGRVSRARCLRCGRTFSRQTFRVSYYMKIHVELEKLLSAFAAGASLRGLGRAHGCTVGSITNRLERLSRQAIAMHQRLLAQIQLKEDLVADGFVDFTVSQYFPDVVTMLSGADSQMIYNIAHCVVRRRGRMTEKQRRRRSELETQYQAERNGEANSLFQLLVDTLPVVWDRRTPLRVRTDEHPEYPRAIKRMSALMPELERPELFTHERINSRQAHRGMSRLFSANYLDRQLRLNMAAHRRETLCYGRNESANLARLVLYMVYQNYNKPYRIVDTAEQPAMHAEVAGVQTSHIKWWWRLLFEARVLFMKVQPHGYLRVVWLKGIHTPLKKRPEYLPKYAYA